MSEEKFCVEYSKSGRASCRGCKQSIAKDVLRLAQMVQSHQFDGLMTMWYHFECFFKKKFKELDSADSIGGFSSIRWEDQEKIRRKLGEAPAASTTTATAAATTTSTSTGKGKGAKKAAEPEEEAEATPDAHDGLKVEYAKSGRSKCAKCSEAIANGEVRLAYMSEKDKLPVAVPVWHHLKCFFEVSSASKIEEFEGHDDLKKADQKKIKDLIKAKATASKKAASKRKGDEEEAEPSTGRGKRRRTTKAAAAEEEEAAEEAKAEMETTTTPAVSLSEDEKALAENREQMRVQSQKIWKNKDLLKSKLDGYTGPARKAFLQDLLDTNSVAVQGKPESEMFDLCADMLTFGVTTMCKDCGKSRLVPKANKYTCPTKTDWGRCLFETDKPEFEKVTLPDDLKEILVGYKYVPTPRVFSLVLKKEKTLTNMIQGKVFIATGTLNSDPQEFNNLKIALGKLGATLNKGPGKSVDYVIVKKDEFDPTDKRITTSLAFNCAVLDAAFLADVESTDKKLDDYQLLAPLPETTAGSSTDTLKRKADEGPKIAKIQVKGKAAVEPESGLERSAHVLEYRGDVYNAVLTRSDISTGHNSYYKLQLLENDTSKRWYVFRAWGRVGTSIGNNKLDDYMNLDQAIKFFNDMFLEKSGNRWQDRKSFVKQPGFMNLVELDYGQDEIASASSKPQVKPGAKTSLHEDIQKLLNLIFDIETMKQTMIEMEIDLNKMPLGKLSKKQLNDAYAVLTKLQDLIKAETSTASRARILEETNRFFTLIPHDFGLARPPLIDNETILTEKIKLIDTLLDIEIATKLLETGADEVDEDPLDVHYKKLHTDLQVVDRESDEFKLIQKYLKNTHAATHSAYELKIQTILKVKRENEDERFQAFKKLHNHQLLWHGSRTSNFAGILSQGLRIAPPEAPATGYMFGKGVYLANASSKSANYCFTNQSKPTGIMLLCEAALGDMYELTSASYMLQPPTGFHSTKGCGKSAPTSEEKLGDVIVPCGNLGPTAKKNSSLLYDEFIVYDVAQVRIQYLLILDFVYRY